MNACSRSTFEETWRRRDKLFLRGGEMKSIYNLDGGQERSLVSHISSCLHVALMESCFEEKMNNKVL